ncbi:MAG: hypothetical protein IPK50_03960 [Fibrobacterota bacterium]|nr:hypothetical protein [Fibrobacterota bacterium]QQS06049.1 MAG: hypothetical protein IPK50_03960 [Fibrobacterota bacterium]
MKPKTSPVHLDTAVTNLARVLESTEDIDHALLIEDTVGRISIGVWSDNGCAVAEEVLREAGGSFFSGSIFHAGDAASSIVELEEAWNTSLPILENGQELSKVRRVVRFRTLTSWQYQQNPLWGLDDGPAIVVFYSYKGGLGRTTTLTSFAIQRARMGDRVAILDLDLEAPGLDLLGRHCEPTPSYGIVDYLLEVHQLDTSPTLTDYSATVAHPDLVGTGSITVFPAGDQNAEYLGKVSRIDLEWELAREAGFKHPLERLLFQLKEELQLDWILIDSRTGFSEVSGLLLSGFAHLHVLFGLQSQQSWSGLSRVVAKLGEERLERDLPQSDAFLVQAMLQDKPSQDRFEEEAEIIFDEHYYAGSENDESDFEAHEPHGTEDIDLLDFESDDAPHKPQGIPYLPAFSQEIDFADSVKLRSLLRGEYREVANRIARRTGRKEQDGQD